ncbi:MAG TPA: biotin carboxylase N-terminal domain-containing protein, partial [Dehalococcoidia bacterium]|nr:biotin carboxylase N-terminal domain-containing protein [Dehalococcoidia bacterium]
PGYGFLSEQAAFAQACQDAGLVFVGPSPKTLHLLGDKVEARRIAEAAGVATVPGSPGRVSPEEARRLAPRVGFPLLIKAAAGGGGKGIRLVEREADLEQALRTAAAEAQASFGDDGVYIERYLDPVRHVEVQVIADSYGNAVHLGERECSVQRRSQKVVEESPSPAVDEELRRRLGEAAVAIARESAYANAGTVEFLLDRDGNFYFIEANARLQVEHPVTELVTGLDLVREQLRVAAGEPLGFSQEDVMLKGWAMECRITAEDASRGFLPCLGRVEGLTEPAGPGIRVDSALFRGWEVGPHYDSLLAKLCAWGETRREAIARMRRALGEYVIAGVQNTLPFHRQLFEDADFLAGRIHTRFLESRSAAAVAPCEDEREALIAAAIVAHERRKQAQGNHAARPSNPWKQAGLRSATERVGGRNWRSTF